MVVSSSDSDTGSGENQLVCRAAGQLRSNPDPKGEADSSSVSIIGTFFIFIGIPNTEPVVKVVPHEVFRIEHGKVLEHRDVCSTEVQPIVEISGHPEQFIQLVVQLICAWRALVWSKTGTPPRRAQPGRESRPWG